MTPCPPKSIGFAKLVIVRNSIVILMQKMKATKGMVIMKIIGNLLLLNLPREAWINRTE
jgi:hypothetical protein